MEHRLRSTYLRGATRTRPARAIGSGLFSVWLLASSPAFAEAPSARSWFDTGVAAYEEGNYTAALAAFQEAYRLSPRPGLLFSIAQTHRRSFEKGGDPADRLQAIAYYERYLAEVPVGDRSTEARSRLAGLDAGPRFVGADAPPPVDADAIAKPVALEASPKTAAMSIDVREHSTPGTITITGRTGAVAFVDGKRVGSLPMPALQALAGTHTIEVVEAGRRSARSVVVLDPGAERRVHLAGPLTARHVASWMLVGVGCAFATAGGIFGYLALEREDEARSLQDTRGARLDFDSAIAARDRLRTAAGLSAGLGFASLLGGTVSLLTQSPPEARSSASFSVKPRQLILAPTTVSVRGTF